MRIFQNPKWVCFDLISNVILLRFGLASIFISAFRWKDGFYRHPIPKQESWKRFLTSPYSFARQGWFLVWRGYANPSLKEATNMLVCGEDLGMVPHCVPMWCKSGYIQSWNTTVPKDPKRNSPGWCALFVSAITPTHDMSTIRGWWEENRKDAAFL